MTRPVTDSGKAAGLWFTLALLAVVALQGLLTWPVRSSSYLLPACVLVPTALLLVAQLAADLARGRAGQPARSALTVCRAVAWLLAMPVLLSAAGLVAGGALYTLACFKIRNGEKWGPSILAAIAVCAALTLLSVALRRPELLAGPLW